MGLTPVAALIMPHILPLHTNVFHLFIKQSDILYNLSPIHLLPLFNNILSDAFGNSIALGGGGGLKYHLQTTPQTKHKNAKMVSAPFLAETVQLVPIPLLEFVIPPTSAARKQKPMLWCLPVLWAKLVFLNGNSLCYGVSPFMALSMLWC